MICSVSSCEKKIAESYSLYKEKKYKNLIDHYRAIIEFKEKNNDEYSKDIAKFYANLSHIYYILRDFNGALEQALKCIEYDSAWYKGYYRAAKASEGLLKKEDALHYYSIMIQSPIGDATGQEINERHNIDINILKEWLINNGAIIDKISIEYYDIDYRGMCVNKPVKPNENLIQIPLKCMISLEESKTRGYNKILTDLGAKFSSPHTYLSLELLDIKNNPAHEFNYIINCLPKYFDNVPINFTEDKLKHLEGSYALVKIAQKKQYLKEEYENIMSLLPDFPYSYEDFVWARTAIITRVYAIERDVGGKPIKDTVMTPFADMANHMIPPNTHWYFDKSNGMFVVKSKQYIPIGDNIFESYGQKCNYRYFVNYGFTICDNPFEEAVIILNPLIITAISQKLYHNKDILELINTSREIFQIGYDIKGEQTKLMIEAAKNKCDELLKSQGHTSSMIEVYTFIIGFINKMLSGFDTTLDEDADVLKNYELSFDMRNCVIQRMGEKKVLKHYINYFNDLIKAEEKNPIERKKFLKKIEKKYKII